LRHSRHGEEEHYYYGEYVKMTCALGHSQHGEEKHYEDGHEDGEYKKTYAPGHSQYGEEEHYENGMCVHRTFAGGHSQHRVKARLARHSAKRIR
jgi:hypothetical protein